MSYMSYIRRALLAVALLVTWTGAQAASTTYFLKEITFETSSVPGQEFPFGAGFLASSVCITCSNSPNTPGVSIAVDDGVGNITLSEVSFTLAGFGADFTDTFVGTTVLGLGVDLDKSSDSCVVNNTATQWCDPTDPRGYAGDWNTGFLANGTTPSTIANFDAVAGIDSLVLSITKSRDNPEAGQFLRMNFKYQVVPVPAAVWLFGSALGLLGWVRRRQTN